jgi:hypothetical protein
MKMKRATASIAIAIAALGIGCGGMRQFPLKDPMWVDQDKRPFMQEPEEYYSSFLWDGADQMAFRPFAKFWKVDPGGESINVNAMDEVPDSAWFTNRIGRSKMTAAEVRSGPCSGPPLDMNGPWTVTGAKPNGANPGFPIKAADGRRYMVKFDGIVQGPRATAADVIVSKLYHAAGYAVPCNEVVFFDRSILRIDPEAMSKNAAGEKIPMTEKDLDIIFSKAGRHPDGRIRGSVSLFVTGKPIGPFRYEETRGDDPNDVIPHEDRRELRANYVIAGWTNHFDSREQNTLDMYVSAEGKGGYVQHNIIDFGDCLGSVWEPPMLGRRIGHSHYFAADHIFQDFVTFGLLKRPWDDNRFGPTGPVLGYYHVDDFVPDDWRPGYPNPAMLRMTERDGAWMARIMARMTPAHILAMIEAGQIHDQKIKAELTRVMLGRRKKSIGRYLTRVSALTEPRVTPGRNELCMEDVAVSGGLLPVSLRQYGARAWVGDNNEQAAVKQVRTSAKQVCIDLPAVPAASPNAPGYLIADLYAFSASQPRTPARVHLYHLGGSDYRVVGLERPYDGDGPG